MRRIVLPAVLAAFCSVFSAMPAAHANVLCDVSGTVLAADGSPVAGVTVAFDNDLGRTPGTTNAAGAFAFASVCGDGRVEVLWSTAPKAGYPAKATLIGYTHVADGDSFAFQLPAPVTATLRLIDKDDAPVVGALVAQANESWESYANPATIQSGADPFDVVVELKGKRTDQSGEVAYQTFPDSAIHLMAYPTAASGLRARDIVLNASTDVTGTLTMSTAAPGSPLVGFVRDAAGDGVNDFYTYLSDVLTSPTRSNSSGLFTVYGPEGTQLLGGSLSKFDDDTGNEKPRPLHTPREFRFSGVPVTVPSESPVQVTLPPLSRVRINAVDAQGQPISARLYSDPKAMSDPAVLVPGTPAVPIHMDIEATYPNGAIQIPVFPTTALSGLQLEWDAPNGDTVYADVPTVDARTDTEITVQFAPLDEKYAVSGTLTDADGKSIPGLRVGSGGNEVAVDATGHFTLPVSAGTSTITVNRGMGWTGYKTHPTVPDSFLLDFPLTVAGDMSVAWRLPRAHEVTIRVVDPTEREPVKGAALRSRADDDNNFFSGLVVQGASAPATAQMAVWANNTDADGTTVFRTWSITNAPDFGLAGKVGKSWFSTTIKDLDVLGNKRLDLVLGASAGSTYQPPSTVSGVTAEKTGTTTTASMMRTAAAPSAQAVVRWSAPRSTGGLKVTGYEVTASPGGAKVRVGSTKRSATLTGLSAGTKYSFTVRAINGIGAAKGKSAALDVAAPKVTVTGPTAGKTKSSSVKATWTGTDDASGVDSYDVRVRSGRTGKALGKWSTVASDTTSTSRTVKLTVGYTYCVSVRAEDKVGRVGAWSAQRCWSRTR